MFNCGCEYEVSPPAHSFSCLHMIFSADSLLPRMLHKKYLSILGNFLPYPKREESQTVVTTTDKIKSTAVD